MATDTNKKFCPNCGAEAHAEGNKIFCDKCDAIYKVSKAGGAQAEKIGPLSDLQNRVAKLEQSQGTRTEPEPETPENGSQQPAEEPEPEPEPEEDNEDLW